jgi:transmembrane sensor
VARPRTQARAEAAAWLARLHGPGRSAEMEEGFRAWLTADSQNARAFERASEYWDATAFVKPGSVSRVAPSNYILPKFRARAGTFGIGGCIAAVSFLGWFLLARDPGLATAVGEQRMVALPDGSRVSLNTNTHLSVGFSKARRTIRLDQGEALFEVTKDSKRPFVVIAGSEEVTAVGTTFVVRRETSRVLVTMIAGKVAITGIPRVPGATVGNSTAQFLTAGERLTADAGAPTVIDEPRVEQVTAWRHGEIVLDNTPLSEAVEEVNRYGPGTLGVDRSAVDYRVSGIFRIGDADAFVHALADLYHLNIVRKDNGIVLTAPTDSAH